MKMSQLDKAIAQLESEKQVIDLAIQRLRAQQSAVKPKRTTKPRTLDVAVAERAS